MYLGEGRIWSVAYLYLLVALLEDFTATQQLVFLGNTPTEDNQFLGLVTPGALRRALMRASPPLEAIYRNIYAKLMSEATGSLRQGIIRQGGVTLQGNLTFADSMVERLIPSYLSRSNEFL